MFTRSSQQLNAVPHQTIISTKNMNIQLKKYTRLTVKITMMAVLLFCLFSVSWLNKDTKKSNGLQNRTVQDSVKPPTDIKGALRLQR